MTRDFDKAERRTVKVAWLPAKINPDGSVENLVQGHVEKDGPERGHWAYTPTSNGMISQMSGKRRWMKGQHNYNRQHNPKNQEENILGTRLMNENAWMMPEKDANGNYEKHLVENAKIVRYGMMQPVYEVTQKVTTHDSIFAKSMKHAQLYLSRKNVQDSAPDSQMKKAGVENSGASESVGRGRVQGGLHQ